MGIEEYTHLEFSPTRPRPKRSKGPEQELIVSECNKSKCGNRSGKRCIAINDPASMWQGGKSCWAFSSDPFHVETVAQAVEDYKEFLRQRAEQRKQAAESNQELIASVQKEQGE